MTEQNFNFIEIRYQTAQVIPPPYAHFFTITLHSASDKRLQVDITMTYTDRDELDEDEITGEGFTTDDDFKWSGYLPSVWSQTVGDLVRKTHLKVFEEEKLSDNQDYFLVTIENEMPGKQSGTPSHRAEWQFLGQELIQATYEVSGKEKPFEVTYTEIDSGVKTEAHLTASFSRREVRLETRHLNKSQSRALPWKELKSMMEIFYAVDYNSEEALTDLPRKSGRYLNLGTTEWYETGTAITGDDGAVSKLRKLLVRLTQP
jgi:hypothetical protein